MRTKYGVFKANYSTMIHIICPYCRKVITMSKDELASTGAHVVCPQCLHDFIPEGVELPEKVPADVDSQRPHVLYCHDCGRELPAPDLRFCPYCGTSLLVVAPSPLEEPAAQPAERTVAAVYDSPASVSSPDESPSPQEPATISFRLKGIPLISTFRRPATRAEVMGSPLLRAVCYFVILLLLALFVWLIWLIVQDASVQ